MKSLFWIQYPPPPARSFYVCVYIYLRPSGEYLTNYLALLYFEVGQPYVIVFFVVVMLWFKAYIFVFREVFLMIIIIIILMTVW
jgi:hypothetical protein